MDQKCDKCKKNPSHISYTETLNGKTMHLHLCKKCANRIIAEKEQFLNSFFDLDPFREVDKMFDSMFGNLSDPGPAKEDRLHELKAKVDKLKQEEGIAVMLQDYTKAAEIKKKREKLQKEAEKIVSP